MDDETPVQEALHELLRAIDDGVEYLDALHRVCRKFNVTPRAIQAEYDSLG